MEKEKKISWALSPEDAPKVIAKIIADPNVVLCSTGVNDEQGDGFEFKDGKLEVIYQNTVPAYVILNFCFRYEQEKGQWFSPDLLGNLEDVDGITTYDPETERDMGGEAFDW